MGVSFGSGIFPGGGGGGGGGGGISGLTAGTIPVAASSSTIADSILFQSAGKIGIATASPTALLHVNGVGKPGVDGLLIEARNSADNFTSTLWMDSNGAITLRSAFTGSADLLLGGTYQLVCNATLALRGDQAFGMLGNGAVALNGATAITWSNNEWYNGADLCLYRDASNVLAQRNGTNAQTFRAYGTYTDASNYVRASLSATSTTVTLAAETAGTGADDVDILLVPGGSGVVDAYTIRFGTYGLLSYGYTFGIVGAAIKETTSGVVVSVGNGQGSFAPGLYVDGPVHSSYMNDMHVNGGGTYGNSQAAGAVHVHGGENWAGGTDSSGGHAYIYGGLGSGTGAVGDTYVGTDGTTPRGVVHLSSPQWVSGTRPAADAAHRGTVWYVAGGTGVADTFEVCLKDGADNHSWVSLV